MIRLATTHDAASAGVLSASFFTIRRAREHRRDTVRTLPTSVLVDKDGYIRSTFIEFEEGALPRYDEQIHVQQAEPPEDPDTPIFAPATSPR